jgi:NADPH:quinone reductase-like Zn-dependent oxidoreductase
MTAIGFLDLIRRGKHKAVVNTAAASQLGRMMVQLLGKRNIPLINIVRKPEHAELLRAMGAPYVLNSAEPDFDRKLAELSRGLNATLVLDAVGGDLTQRLVDASPMGSSIVLYANLSRQPASILPNSLYNYNRRIEGFYLGVWSAKQSMPKILRAARQAQQLAGSELSTTFRKRLPLAEAQEALELYRKDMTAGKVLLVVGE